MTLDPDGFFNRVCEALEIEPGRGAKAKVAQKVKFNKSSVGLWEKGEMPGMNSLQNVMQVSKLSNTSLHWLLTGEGQKEIEPSGSNVEFTSAERQLIQKLADDKEMRFEGMVRELVLDAIFSRGAEMLANRKDIATPELRALNLIFNLLPDADAAEAEMPGNQRAVKEA